MPIPIYYLLWRQYHAQPILVPPTDGPHQDGTVAVVIGVVAAVLPLILRALAGWLGHRANGEKTP